VGMGGGAPFVGIRRWHLLTLGGELVRHVVCEKKNSKGA
jgi:hypothetical protein